MNYLEAEPDVCPLRALTATGAIRAEMDPAALRHLPAKSIGRGLRTVPGRGLWPYPSVDTGRAPDSRIGKITLVEKANIFGHKTEPCLQIGQERG